MKRNLLIWNGMVSQQVSGGDVYVKNLARGVKKPLDIVTTHYALQLLGKSGHSVTGTNDRLTATNGLLIAAIYLLRALIWSPRMFLRSRRVTYETVIAASPFVCDVIPVVFSKTNNRVVVLFHLLPERESTDIGTWLRFVTARIEQRAMLTMIKWRFNTILVGNDELRNELELRFPHKKILVAHAGIDTVKIDSVSDEKKDKNLGIFVGRLTTQKGILDLVRIASLVHGYNNKFHLMVIGDGPDRAQLEAEVRKYNATSYITLRGFVGETEKYALMKRAQFFIFPSYEEGWGIALAEAMYAGCNCICYKLNHYEGIFAQYPKYASLGDVEGMAKLVISNYKEPSSSSQSRFIAKYDSKKVVNSILANLALLKSSS